MMATDTTPRAWVGCLGCYAAGRLHGVWVPGIEADDLIALSERGLDNDGLTCRKCGSDEWWVFDFEGYGPALKGECSPVEAQRVAEALEDVPEGEREAFAAYLEYVGDLETALENFEEAYAGEWEDLEDFAAELVEDHGMLHGVDETIARYFDVAAFARDLELGGDYFSAPAGGGYVHVFRGDV